MNLASDPAPSVFLGEFERGEVTLTDPALPGGVRPDEVTVNLEPFDLDVLGTATSGSI